MGEAPTTDAPTTEASWPQLGADNRKCAREKHGVASRLACQTEAVDKGHTYYQYQAVGKKCATAATCGSPITGTDGKMDPWKIYHQAPTTEAPTTEAPTTEASWPQLGADNRKCLRDKHG